MYSVPFSLPEAYGGLAEANGVARFDGRELRLEYVIKDAVIGVVNSGVKLVNIAVGDISSVTFNRNVFRGRIILLCHSVGAIANIPGQKGGEIRLSIRKKHCDSAEELISALRLAVSEAKLNALQKVEEEAAREEFERLHREGGASGQNSDTLPS